MLPATLPVLPASMATAVGPPTRSRSRVVLIASSDSSLRQRLRQSLTGLRWQVIEAPGGADAWVASQETSQLEAVLIDSWLPDLDVAEWLADFHREHPHVDLMMSDGTSVDGSPRSPYHQELLYALRRSQDVDTVAWQTATDLNSDRESGLNSVLNPDYRMGLRSGSNLSPGRSSMTELPSLASSILTQSGGRASAQGDNASPSPHFMRTEGIVLPETPSETKTNVQAKAQAKLESGLPTGTEDDGYASSAPGPFASAVTPAPNTPPLVSVVRRENAAVERIPELIGTSASMLEVSRRIRLVAARSTPVLIEGPTGSGKELVAEALHRLSSRNRKPLVAINCAAIPEALLEAELFGHTRGAFTGAVQGRTGRIEAADGGTLFLDEIGEMPLGLQSKLLRFFESGELQRIGDNETVKVDVRIVAATHQPLAEDAQKGLFRADLYYRLAVFLIRTPALIEHMEDLPQLVRHFMDRMGRKSPVKRIDTSAMQRLAGHGWPGNVRELEHVLERAAILAGDEPIITASEIDFGLFLMN